MKKINNIITIVLTISVCFISTTPAYAINSDESINQNIHNDHVHN